jgi:hypothetical protein
VYHLGFDTEEEEEEEVLAWSVITVGVRRPLPNAPRYVAGLLKGVAQQDYPQLVPIGVVRLKTAGRG